MLKRCARFSQVKQLVDFTQHFMFVCQLSCQHERRSFGLMELEEGGATGGRGRLISGTVAKAFAPSCTMQFNEVSILDRPLTPLISDMKLTDAVIVQ